MSDVEATSKAVQVPVESLFVIAGSVALYVLFCGVVAAVFERLNVQAPALDDPLTIKLLKSRQFWMRSIFAVMAAILGPLRIEHTCGRGLETHYCDDWHLMFWYGLVLIATANISSAAYEFYLGEGLSLFDNIKFYFCNKRVATRRELEEASQQRWLADGDRAEGTVTFYTLMPSVFITWIFAKSIRNSAALGGMYGMLGGLGYAAWYTSFFTSGFVCYILRSRYNFKSLPIAIYKNYGAVALIFFQICVFWRLFNEVWSNAGVIGGFYGPAGSPGYWGGAWLSVLIPVVYVFMGGMRASLFSDVFQAGLAISFLVVVLATIGSDKGFSGATDAFSWRPTTLYKSSVEGEWYDGGWWVLTLSGLIQGCISYPFFDPVLTDRAFLGTPKTMLKSFIVGGGVAALFVVFFAVIGVYGAFWKEHFLNECGCDSGAKGSSVTPECPTDWNPCSYLTGSAGEPSTVAVILGRKTYGVVEVFVNFIMITASMSTLDSTFTSASKLVSLELCGWLRLKGDNRPFNGPLIPQDLTNIGEAHISVARWTMVLLGLWSTSFLALEGDVMKATTAAGSSVMGIGAPIWFMTVWRTKQVGQRGWRQAPLAFIVPGVVGFFFGLSYWWQGLKDAEGEVYGGWTYDLQFGYDENKGTHFYYARLFGVNLVGHAICIVLFFVFFVIHQLLPETCERVFPQVGQESADGTIVGKSDDEGEGKATLSSESEAHAPKQDELIQV